MSEVLRKGVKRIYDKKVTVVHDVNLHVRSDNDAVVMVIPTMDLKVDVSMGATVNFTAQPRPIQLFDKASGNNLIWYDKVSAAANAPVCARY